MNLCQQNCLTVSEKIVSVLHQNEGGIGKSIPDAREISRGRSLKEISRVEGNLEGGGDGFLNTSRVLVEYGHSLIINLSIRNSDQKFLPCGQGRIDGVKINPSLLMLRE